MTKITKTQKLLNALKAGGQTTKQLMTRTGLASPNAVTGTIHRLKTEGYDFYTTKGKGGVTKYNLA